MISLPSTAVFRHRSYLHYWVMRQLISSSRQMTAVAIGWQIYDLARATRSIEESSLLLGFVGLAQFLPVLFLSLVGGQAADRLDRKMILIVSNAVRALATLALIGASTLSSAVAIPSIFVVATIFGAVNAFTPAASNSLYPTLVPKTELPQAIAWNSLGFNAAAIVGPALGGVLYIRGPFVVYGAAVIMIVISIIAIATAQTPKQAPVRNARGIAMVIEGLRYVRDNRIVFGAISLDLIVVLFGGATALLPVFARDILHTGADGLGLLRAAPAIGAAVVAFLLAARPLSRRVGPTLLIAVATYGVAMLVFAWSAIFWLSLLALAISGAADMISVYVRQSLVTIATPDGMRGRVSSVAFIFISASNELGEFESGLAARFLGPVGAVILGGVMAVATAGAYWRFFPVLSRADSFEGAAAQAALPATSAPGRLEPQFAETQKQAGGNG
ncbi:MAG: MFS transporter [Alphaproteobacteria bacterium]|nr:MFS transporter [Alphaproteobacteria bacterium]